MSSPELYRKIHSAHAGKIRSGQIEIDDVLSSGKPDTRRGISLIIPIKQIAHAYHGIVRRFSEIDADQYYYPVEDLHVTIFDFIQGTIEYVGNEPLDAMSLKILQQAAQSSEAFELELAGLVFRRAAGLLKDYDDGRLVTLKENIRDLMQACGIQNGERYASESAHVTFLRFRHRLENADLFAEEIDQYSEIVIGVEKVSRLELVEHDWYNALATKRVIGQVDLMPTGH